MRANDFIDYQNPYMFVETRFKVSREQYDEPKALYPSLEDLQPGVSQSLQANKNLRNLKFKMWAKEMQEKLQRHKEEVDEDNQE